MEPVRRFVLDFGASKEYANRPAVGIVRTEREFAKVLLHRKINAVFVYFDKVSSTYREIREKYVRQILGLPSQGNDTNSLEYGPQFRFQNSDIFVNCGLPWDSNSHAILAQARRQIGFHVCQIIYDVIPTLMPEFCVPGMEDRFPRFLIDTAKLADSIFCISDCTARDLASFYRHINVSHPSLSRIELGIDEISPANTLDTSSFLGDFVLFVSSIEPRKNHFAIFNVWRRLFEMHGKSLPKLVFVGSQGWNMNDLRYFIVNSEIYREGKIEIAANLPDIELDRMYRSCLFTVYPSLYEGWGLPVSESIAYKKLCIASSSSSIPEAAQGLMELIDPHDFVSWVNTCSHFIENRKELELRSQRIADKGSLKNWNACMTSFIADVERQCANTCSRI